MGGATVGAEAQYLSRKGERFLWSSCSSAATRSYSLLTIVAKLMNGGVPTEDIGIASDVGTASVVHLDRLPF